MRKKFLSVLLTLAMVLALVPATAMAAGELTVAASSTQETDIDKIVYGTAEVSLNVKGEAITVTPKVETADGTLPDNYNTGLADVAITDATNGKDFTIDTSKWTVGTYTVTLTEKNPTGEAKDGSATVKIIAANPTRISYGEGTDETVLYTTVKDETATASPEVVVAAADGKLAKTDFPEVTIKGVNNEVNGETAPAVSIGAIEWYSDAQYNTKVNLEAIGDVTLDETGTAYYWKFVASADAGCNYADTADGIKGSVTFKKAAAVTGVKVSGTVVAGTTEATVDGIEVTLTKGQDTKTATVTAGKYEFTDVAEGTWTLAIAKAADDKYAAVSEEIVVAKVDVTKDITLVAPTPVTGVKVSGTVAAGATGATVDGITVTLTKGQDTKTATVTEGKYEFTDVAEGTWTLAIAKAADDKYAAVSEEIEVAKVDVTKNITLVAPTPSTVPVESVVFDPKTVSATYGDKNVKVSAKVTPEGATEKGITYTSGDEEIATVGTDGTLTIKKAGSVTITAKSVEDNTITDTCAVTINKAEYTYVGPANQTMAKATATLAGITANEKGVGVNSEQVAGTLAYFTDAEHNTAATNATLTDATAETEVTLYWTFTATDTNYSDTPKEGTVKITVTALSIQVPTFAEATVTKSFGDPKFTKAAVNKVDGAEVNDGGAITYSIAPETVATIDPATGEVTIVGAGTATITATAAAVDSKYAANTGTYTLTVEPMNVTITAKDQEIEANGAIKNTDEWYTIAPDTAKDAFTVTLAIKDGVDTSTAAEIAGGVVATAEIKAPAKAENYNVTTTAGKLTIKAATGGDIAVTGVALDKSEATVAVGKKVVLTATITPSDATNQAITAESSDTTKATVAVEGKTVTVTGVAVGEHIIITVKSVADETKEATCEVTVTAAPVVKPAAPEVKTDVDVQGAGTTPEQVEAVKDAISEENVVDTNSLKGAFDAVEDYVAPSQAEITAAESNPNLKGDGSTRVVVQTYVEVTIKNVDLAPATGPKVVKYDVTPKYRTVVTKQTTDEAITTDNSVIVCGGAKELTVEKATVTLHVPADLAAVGEPVYVTHTKEDGTKYYYTLKVLTGNIVTFVNEHGFSELAVANDLPDEAADKVAKVGDSEELLTIAEAFAKAIETGKAITLVGDVAATTIDLSAAEEGTTITINGNDHIKGKLTFTVTSGLDVEATKSGTTTTLKVVKAGTSDPGEDDPTKPSRGHGGSHSLDEIKGGRYDNLPKDDDDKVIGGDSNVDPSNPFVDVATSDPYYDAIMEVYKRGWMVGISDNTFASSGTLTRGMAAQILWNKAGNPAPASVSPFLDVTSDKWYATAIAWAYEQGLVLGYDGTTFGPDDFVTTEQFTIMLDKAAGNTPAPYVGGAANATRGWVANEIVK